MRILFHHRTLADGAEGVHISSMIAAFESLGHEVLLLGTMPESTRRARPGRLDGLRRLMPESVVELVAVAANLVEYPVALRAIRRFRPHLVYKRHGRFDIATLWAARHARVRSLLEVNCLYSQHPYVDFEPLWLRSLAASMERRALRLADRGFAVSSPLARMSQTLAARDIAVIPNGVDLTRFNPATARPAEIRLRYDLGDQFVVGWAGVLRQWHGLDLLLTALKDLPSARLLIVGDGPERATILRLADTLGVGRRVTITGRVAHGEMADHIAAMDVAVVADDRTGMASPMKLLEYMAMARPVVAPALDNMADVIVDGVSGLLFAPRRPEALVERIRRLGEDPTLRARLGQAARDAVRIHRSWAAVARVALEIADGGSATGGYT